MLILISGTVIFLNYSKTSSDQVVAGQLNMIGSSIMNNAEAMYVLGNESWVTIEFNFPNSVNSAAINSNQEMYFSYATSKGISNAVFFSDKFNISSSSAGCPTTCNLDFTPGMNRIKIKSTGKFVTITKVY